MDVQNNKVFSYKGRVYFGDTDAAGVVYHGRYIYWMEAARIELLDELSLPYADLQKQKIGLIPVDISISYKVPLKFGERFTLTTQLISMKRASFVLENKFMNEPGSICCTAKVQLACLDESTWKPRVLPNDLQQIFKPLL